MTSFPNIQPQIAYSYIRFSSALQAEGDSFRRQLATTRAYCQQRGMQLDESLQLRDLGVSGFNGRNIEKGALGTFLDACREGRIKRGSALVIESLDRLTRQRPRKAVGLLTSLLDDYGIDVHVTSIGKVFLAESESEGIDLILAVAMAIRANEESETKSRRLREVWAQKRKRASETKTFMRADLPWWLTYENGKIVSPPARRATVLEIFKLTAAGNSSAQVARLLTSRQVPTWRPQARWTSMRVRDLVRSKGPQGILEATRKTRLAGRGYELSGYYPAIVPDALAASARAVLANNTRGNRGRQPESNRPINMFRGLLRYLGCWTRHATRQNGEIDPATGEKGWNSYYECFDELAEAKRGKLLFCISAKQLEPLVFAGLSELKPADLAPVGPDTAAIHLEHFDQQLAELEQTRKNLEKAVEETGSISLANRLVEVEKELGQKRSERAQVLRKAPTRINPREFKAIVDNLDKPEVRSRAAVALRGIVTRIDVARSFDGLPISDDVRRRFIEQRATLVAGANVFQDPVKQDKRRKPLHVLVSFSTGVARYIGRIEGAEDVLLSWRVEPQQAQAA